MLRRCVGAGAIRACALNTTTSGNGKTWPHPSAHAATTAITAVSAAPWLRSCQRCCTAAAPMTADGTVQQQQRASYETTAGTEATKAEEEVDSFRAGRLSDKQREFIAAFRAKVAAAPEGDQDLERFAAPPPHEDGTAAASSDQLLREPSVSAPAAIVGLKRGEQALPRWLKLQVPKGAVGHPKYIQIRNAVRKKKLATVCEEAKCPNIGECWGGDKETGEGATATIMLMGDTCTRGCRFCSVKTSRTPKPLDPEEPNNAAEAVAEMEVDYIVMTMVDRDDLADGGANHVAKTIRRVKEVTPKILIECLVGDFQGRENLVEIIASSPLDTYAHNIECVERVTPQVRDRRANYRQTLKVLEHAKRHNPVLLTKSSIMLGFDERPEEIRQTLRDLRTAGVQCVTLGQYLQPSSTRMKVGRYVHPDEFAQWKAEADALGFLYCASGPMVRSSYRAGEFFLKSILRGREVTAGQEQQHQQPSEHQKS